jgi:hypothetical protein
VLAGAVATFYADSTGSGTFSQDCGSVSTCCVAIVCRNILLDCKGMSYITNFKTVLSGGVVAGIVIGSLVGLALLVLCLRAICRCCGTTTSTTAYVTMAAAPQPNPAYGQGGNPGGYYGGPYKGDPGQGAPPAFQTAPQQYASPQYHMPQSAPQAWG